MDEKTDIKDKLTVLIHISRQLQEIDKQGFVIFDRKGDNIQVLKWGNIGVSTRQIDIEYMYDKTTDCVYRTKDESMNDQLADLFKQKNVDLWTLTVSELALEGVIVAQASGQNQAVQALLPLTNQPSKPLQSRSLQELEAALITALKTIDSEIDGGTKIDTQLTEG